MKPLTRATVIGVLVGCLIVAGGITALIKHREHPRESNAVTVNRREINANIGEQLFRAARSGNVDRLKSILDKYPDQINAPGNSYGSTALQAAVWYSQPLAVNELLRQKANVNATNAFGITPLHDCAQRGTAEIAQLLLDHGADVTLRNRAGQTPLQVAMESDNTNVADVLRQHGAQE